jgi:chemotaxis protein methyltransferase CheR
LERLEILLSKNIRAFEIYFKNLYFLPPKCIEIFHRYQEDYNKKIDMYPNKARLSKYLYNLGFHTHLDLEMPLKVEKQDVLVIGGSSNSSEKVIEILSHIDTSKFIIFIVQHISDNFKMVFDTVLAPYVKSRVLYAKAGMEVSKGNIYIAPADYHLKVENKLIALDKSPLVNSARPSISVTFRSLSQEYKETLLAILTCGYESDGVDALVDLKKNSSLSIVQDPKECLANSIPTQAKIHGIYDYIFTTKTVIKYLQLLQKKFLSKEESISYLLNEISIEYEYDFKHYSHDSILRRVEYFRVKYKISDIYSLLILVLFNVSIFKALFLELSINVTEFFRKELSSKNMIKLIEKEYKNCYNIKIWSAGCSSGKEVYSTAIILNELGLLEKSIIYATDFNPVIIEEAKSGIYELNAYIKAEKKYKNLGLERDLKEYFSINNRYIQVIDSIRKRVNFFVHNLEKDSVFNEFDMIECKNVLIYFDTALTEKVFQLLYDSLKFGGHLLIGESEEIPRSFQNKFKKCDDNCKIYRKIIE